MNPHKVKQYSLYKTLTPSKAKLYSLFKLGHVPSLNKISGGMVRFISKTISPLERKNIVIYATNKSPVDDSCKKSSFLLAENVAKSLGVPLLAGEYSHIFNDVKFYNKHKSFRKTAIHVSLLKNKNKLKHQGCQIIMVDDSIVTGISLKDSLKTLFKITRHVTFFSVIKLNPKKQLELDLNDYIFKKNSYSILPKIIMGDGYRFTTQMLRIINDLSPLELKNFINKIDPSQRKQLDRGFKNFFNHALCLRPIV